MESVSIIIPISKNIESRDKSFKWVKAFYEKMFPEYELCIGASDEQPFPKAKVINKAVKESNGDILVIADADLIYDPNLLKESIKKLDSHAWVIPFRKVLNISKESTQKLLEEEPQWPIPIPVDTKKRPHAAMGGINIVPRELFDAVCGFDERFVGWGGEDDAFAASLNSLCGYVKRMDGTLYHLWHKRGSLTNYKENRELLRHYRKGKEAIKNQVEIRRSMME
ncbi:galactosyltransferase-related protein [Virgibacillus byunsanensis]|uniref:Galactosyltransferase-related protein n=1 Tax=Virgibacillus byunsanensis TaxID=570945 RepID=A0ABW3LNU9_9BACI